MPDADWKHLAHTLRLGTHRLLMRKMHEKKQTQAEGHGVGASTPILGSSNLAMVPRREFFARDVLFIGSCNKDTIDSKLMLRKS